MNNFTSRFREYKNLFLIILLLNTIMVFFTAYKYPVPSGFDIPYYLFRTDILFEEGVIKNPPPWNMTSVNGNVVGGFVDYPSVYLILNLLSYFFSDFLLPAIYEVIISNLLLVSVFYLVKKKTSDEIALLSCLFILSSYAYILMVYGLLKNILGYLILILLIQLLSEEKSKFHFVLMSLAVFSLAVTHTLIFIYLAIMFVILLKFYYEKRHYDLKYYLSAVLIGLILSMPIANFLFFNYESNIFMRAIKLWNFNTILSPVINHFGILFNITLESIMSGNNLIWTIIGSEIFSFSKLTIIFYFNLFLFPFFLIGFFDHLKKIKKIDDKDFFILMFSLGSLASFILEFIYPSRALLLLVFPFCYYAALGFMKLKKSDRDKMFVSIILSIIFLGILELGKVFSIISAHNFYSISELIDEFGIIYLFLLGSIIIMISKIDPKISKKVSNFIGILFIIMIILPQAYYVSNVYPYASEGELEVTTYVNTYLSNSSFIVVPRFYNWFFYFTRTQAELSYQQNFYLAFFNESVDYFVWVEPYFEWVPIFLDMVNLSAYPIIFNNSDAIIYKIR